MKSECLNSRVNKFRNNFSLICLNLIKQNNVGHYFLYSLLCVGLPMFFFCMGSASKSQYLWHLSWQLKLKWKQFKSLLKMYFATLLSFMVELNLPFHVSMDESIFISVITTTRSKMQWIAFHR